jgi:hypothetical protein
MSEAEVAYVAREKLSNISKTSVTVADVPGEIPTKHFLNTTEEHY